MTLEHARTLAHVAHRGQHDKLGIEYVHHVEAVAAGLVDFDLDIQIAGMLHDVVEDSEFTLEDLRARGVSERSLAAIELVSRNLHPDLSYDEAIQLDQHVVGRDAGEDRRQRTQLAARPCGRLGTRHRKADEPEVCTRTRGPLLGRSGRRGGDDPPSRVAPSPS